MPPRPNAASARPRPGPLTTLLDRWLAPTRHGTDLATPGVGFVGRHVLARGLCRMRRVSLDGIAPRDRIGRLRIEAAQWRPFDDADHAAWLQGDAAWICAWDRGAFEQRITALSRAPRVRKVLPETLLAPPLVGDGVRLLRCAEGCEGQAWQAGALVSCRWWPREPDPQEWRIFLRGSGLAPGGEGVPSAEPIAPGASAAAWKAARMLGGTAGSEGAATPVVAAALALAFAGPAALVARDHWAVYREIESLRGQLDTLRAQAAPVLEARREALEGLSGLERTSAWLSAPDPIRALAEVARKVPADGSVIREFEFTQDQLRLTLVPGRGTARVTYVRALEEGGTWLQVREESGEGATDGQLMLRARLAARPAGSEGVAR